MFRSDCFQANKCEVPVIIWHHWAYCNGYIQYYNHKVYLLHKICIKIVTKEIYSYIWKLTWAWYYGQRIKRWGESFHINILHQAAVFSDKESKQVCCHVPHPPDMPSAGFTQTSTNMVISMKDLIVGLTHVVSSLQVGSSWSWVNKNN